MMRYLGSVLVVAMLISYAQSQRKPAPSQKPAVADSLNPLVAYPHFSAMMSGGFLKEDPHKIYRSGDLLRVDMEGGYYRITNLEKKIMWSVHPDRCTKIERPDARSYPFTLFRNTKFEPPANDDKETIDGHSCAIQTATFAPEGMPNLSTKMKLWKADDLQGFPIKIEAVHPSRTLTVTYQNVSLDRPDASLFVLPATCTDFETGVKKPTGKPGKTAGKPPGESH